MNIHEKISYIEFPAKNLPATKTFFAIVFGWEFEDFGFEYTAFSCKDGIDGGFFQSDYVSTAEDGAGLAVFFSENLEATQAKIEAAGGKILKPIFSFPGGSRFHFQEPSGNEFAVWSDKES